MTTNAAPPSTRATKPPQGAPHPHAHGPTGGLLPLALGALGVVYGDIGTSPLYTLKECLAFSAEHSGRAVTPGDVLGLLSLIVWSLTLVVTVKYLAFIMRADNRGEGGIFALLAVVPARLRGGDSLRVTWLSALVVVGAALLYGDGAITPAISVLSAVEGLGVARPELAHYAVPLTCAILVVLFAIQRKGTATVGKLFGPVMIAWFSTLAGLGAYHISQNPAVLAALSPAHAARYLAEHGGRGWLILGSVVLAVTGGEALYADMGHFGARPIRLSWLAFVKPALVLAYFGQGALVLADPSAAKNPFFGMVPPGNFALALVLLSSAATVIASQALISGAFSLTRQAMQLGYFPRVTVKHTASEAEGQIYIPEVNLALAVACLTLVVSFRESTHLAAAYGIAVTGTMAITSVVFYVVTREVWGWSAAKAVPLLALFLAVDLAFLVANLFKFFEGGFVPVLIAAAIVASMLIWSRGRTLIVERYRQRFPRVEDVYPLVEARLAARVPGTGIFLGSSSDHVPPALVQHVERNRSLHEHVILLTVKTADVPYFDGERVETRELPFGMKRVIVNYGFMEQPDLPAVLRTYCASCDTPFDEKDTTYYLGREIILATDEGMMGSVAEGVFAYLQRNTGRADRHFRIPPSQVVEIGSQIDLLEQTAGPRAARQPPGRVSGPRTSALRRPSASAEGRTWHRSPGQRGALQPRLLDPRTVSRARRPPQPAARRRPARLKGPPQPAGCRAERGGRSTRACSGEANHMLGQVNGHEGRSARNAGYENEGVHRSRHHDVDAERGPDGESNVDGPQRHDVTPPGFSTQGYLNSLGARPPQVGNSNNFPLMPLHGPGVDNVRGALNGTTTSAAKGSPLTQTMAFMLMGMKLGWGAAAFIAARGWGVAKGVGGKAFGFAKGVGGKAFGFVKGAAGKTFGFIKGVGGKAFGFVKGAGGKAFGFVKGAAGKAFGFVKGVGGKAFGFLKGVGGKTFGFLKGVGGKTFGFLKGVGGKATGFVKDLGGRAVKAGKGIGKGIGKFLGF